MNDFQGQKQSATFSNPHARGIFVRAAHQEDLLKTQRNIESLASRYQIQAYLNIQSVQIEQGTGILISSSETLNLLTPNHDTLGLSASLKLNGLKRSKDLELEIILSMSRSPVLFTYPSFLEFESAVRVRRNAALAAYQAELNFDTEGLERPRDCWTYHPDTSFTLLPNVPIIDAMIQTMQPALSGKVYSFSCFRASEYILTLALALELRDCHPDLHRQIESRWSKRAIMGEEFQAVFLREYGSIDAPIPPRYYVPGERVWFRNPDEPSSDVRGYEGSWLYYLGSGLFNNFWDRQNPYNIVSKCLEIYHWRDGLGTSPQGELVIDESVVSQRVGQTLNAPEEVERIMGLMMRYRDPYGVYAQGGCIDATRESFRWLHPSSTDISIPDANVN